MEFKGTKGNWTRVKLETTQFYVERNEIHYGKDGEMIAEFVHDDYDAQLISKAPEMLELLKNLIPVLLENKETGWSYDVEQLIKEATTIQNERQ